MSSLRYVRWQDGDMWLGYLENYPDYMTQGESLLELEENLRDIYADLRSGAIPSVRSIAELQVQ
ncbi:MAG: type II toxin-antitoxin system HicB family antitoxin [Verrucomicrobia bacterium]|nr:type II toxin-antitoxin system HicB family antitoxin [Verrucomicrobiota bacterium]